MDHLFWIARSLFGAKRKVKLLAVVLAYFSVLAHAGTSLKQTDYGPYVIEQAAMWLPDYLEGTLLAYRYINHLQPPEDAAKLVRPQNLRQVELLKELYDLSKEFLRRNFKGTYIRPPGSSYFEPQITRGTHIQFRRGGDKVFDLAGKPPRMAVTGTALDSDVIFNLGLISNPKEFSFSEALGLWMHELGHKLPEGKYTQEEIDEAAGFVSQRFADQMMLQPFGGRELIVINLVPYEREGDVHGGPFPMAESRRKSLFGVLNGTKFIDLTVQLNAELDRFAHPQSNKLEVVRNILEIMPTRESAEGQEFFVQLRTSRFPKNLNFYLIDELGPNYYKSARLNLSADLKTLTAVQYRDEPAPKELITDGDAEFSGPLLVPESGELRFLLSLHLKNQTHFHAAGYPDWRFTINALLDGEPVRLEANVRWRMDRLSTGLPAEVYKKQFTKLGAVSINLRELHGKDLQLIGMEDRFFTLGAGYEEPQGELKRILLRAPLLVNLKNCENILKP